MFLTLPVIVIATLLLGVVLRRPGVRGRAGLLTFSISLILWTGAYGFFLNSTPSSALIWLSLIYLGATVASTSLLTYTLSYINHRAWLSRWSLALLAAEPLLTQALIWIPRWRHLFLPPAPNHLGWFSPPGPGTGSTRPIPMACLCFP